MTLRTILWIAVSTKNQADEERASLPQQEADLRALAAKLDLDIVDVLVVPGFSRRYLSWEEFARSASFDKKKIDAPRRMLTHWDNKDFDVVAFWDGTRFGRTQTLFAYFVERSIDEGMALYSWKDGWITAQNFRMYVAMGGYASAEELDKFVKRSQMGKAKAAERGLSFTRPYFSHRVERDANGKRLRLVVNETFRRLFLDLANLLLTRPRLSWDGIADALNRRGHRTVAGNLFVGVYIKQVATHPQVWGHLAQHFSKRSLERWRFDPSIAPPEGVTMHPGLVEPVWSGELAERLRREIIDRESIGERQSPSGKYAFTGLLVCAECNCNMSVSIKAHYIAWHCYTARLVKTRPFMRVTTCTNLKSISNKHVMAWFEDKFALAHAKGIAALEAPTDRPDALDATRLTALDADIARLRAQMDRWINELSSDLTDRVRHQIRASLNETDAQLEPLEQQRRELTAHLDEPDDTGQHQQALDTILANRDFWTLPPSEINRQLRDLLGTHRVMVKEGHIVGIGKPHT